MGLRMLVRNLRLMAERVTERRMGRERNDDTDDDESWDLEYAQALQDVQTNRFDDMRDKTK